MQSEFKEGEIVIVNPHVEAKSNDYVVVKNDEDEATFKQSGKEFSLFTFYISPFTAF